ncbi:MAG TPA: hypothetical protein VMH41_12025, partial [Mycobacteriales bacterium]|nr:hypothetical protein [Mycobacteriales bacterium]
MEITEDDIDELVRISDRGRDEWIHGRLLWEELGSGISQAPDATIFGPLGGVAPRGEAPVIDPDAQKAVAAKFKGGDGDTELIRAIVLGDVVVLVMVDRSQVQFEGYEDPKPWELRITEIFRR